VARCPHLGLGEHGTTPFPFPSPSHHCYLATPALLVGQREQQHYCLSKRYKECPLYVSRFPQETLDARVPETTPARLGAEAAVESPLKERVEAREADEQTRDEAPQVAVPPKAPEPAVQPASMKEMEPPAPREPLAEEPLVIKDKLGVPEPTLDKVAESVTPRVARKPDIEPARMEEVERPRSGEVLVQEPSLSAADDEVTGAAEPSPEGDARPRRLRVSSKVLWTAMGGAFLLFVCVGGLVVVGVVSSSLGIDAASLLHISSAPNALLVVSVASFLGAIPLLALVIWVLRQGPR